VREFDYVPFSMVCFFLSFPNLNSDVDDFVEAVNSAQGFEVSEKHLFRNQEETNKILCYFDDGFFQHSRLKKKN
jgi:hypothetical protein